MLSLLFLIACETTIGDCVDADGDGVGVGIACEQIDCDDDDPTVQVCGGDRPEDTDIDADGFTADEDCDDTDPAVNPGAIERCNGVDEDCDGDIDEEASDAAPWFADTDADGFGDPNTTTTACAAPSGYVGDNTDCNDSQSAVSPNAVELCNEIDDNCDGDVDEDGGPILWYADTDADGFGDPNALTEEACTAPDGTVADNSDCDDTTASVSPGVDEVCNTIDDDCDGDVDEEPTDGSTYFLDADGDGAGDPNEAFKSCDFPDGYAQTAYDCNDDDPDHYPLALDYPGDGIDSDCDGVDLPAPDAANAFYVSSDFGDDGSGDGTQSKPYRTITHAISQSQSGDWLLLDSGVYVEDIHAARHVVGSFNSQTGWSLDITQRSSFIFGGSAGAFTAGLQADERASLTGLDISGSGDTAIKTNGEASSQLVLNNTRVSGRALVDGVSLGMLETDVAGSQFALRVIQKVGNTAHITDSTIAGAIAGAWIGSDAVLTDSTFTGSNGLLLRPDVEPSHVSMTRVRLQGETNGATLTAVTATITDSEIINTLTLPDSSTQTQALQLTQGADVTVNRSRLVTGSPSVPVINVAFFSGIYADSSTLLLANSVVESWADAESNSHAYGVRGLRSSSITLVNSTVLTDVRDGGTAAGLYVTDGSALTAINLALYTQAKGFQSNRGLWLESNVTTTLAAVALNAATSPLAFVYTSSFDHSQLTQLSELEACDWGDCAEVRSVLFEDLELNDPSSGDVVPSSTSPLNNAGIDPLSVDSSLPPELLSTDIAGSARTTDGPWDIGAYEMN